MTSLASELRSRRLPPTPDVEPGLRRGIRGNGAMHNWALYAFVLLIPLQNIYSTYLPNLGGGLNFLNVMFLASLVVALQCGGRLVRGSGVNGWVMAYLAVGIVALLVGYRTVEDPSGHLNTLKDQSIAVAFVFLAQLSVQDWPGVRRLLLISLLPLPYMFWVLLDQHSAVESWHYDHALRIAGTFSQLGANELAAFCSTTLLLCLALLLALRLQWGWRSVLIGAALITGTGVVLTYSRTAYVGVLVAAAVIALLHRRRARLVLPALMLAIALPVLLPNSAIQRFESIELEEGQRDESTANRFLYWEVAFNRFLEQPVLGTGFHTFHHEEVNPFRTDTHNFYLRELVEKGLLGGVVLLGMLFAVGRMLWRLLRASRTGTWPYALALGLIGAFVGVLLGNLFGDRFSHYPMIAHFWLYVGLALRATALQQQAQQQQVAVPESPWLRELKAAMAGREAPSTDIRGT